MNAVLLNSSFKGFLERATKKGKIRSCLTSIKACGSLSNILESELSSQDWTLYSARCVPTPIQILLKAP